jgi:hypothetical protein
LAQATPILLFRGGLGWFQPALFGHSFFFL